MVEIAAGCTPGTEAGRLADEIERTRRGEAVREIAIPLALHGLAPVLPGEVGERLELGEKVADDADAIREEQERAQADQEALRIAQHREALAQAKRHRAERERYLAEMERDLAERQRAAEAARIEWRQRNQGYGPEL